MTSTPSLGFSVPVAAHATVVAVDVAVVVASSCVTSPGDISVVFNNLNIERRMVLQLNVAVSLVPIPKSSALISIETEPPKL